MNGVTNDKQTKDAGEDKHYSTSGTVRRTVGCDKSDEAEEPDYPEKDLEEVHSVFTNLGF